MQYNLRQHTELADEAHSEIERTCGGIKDSVQHHMATSLKLWPFLKNIFVFWLDYIFFQRTVKETTTYILNKYKQTKVHVCLLKPKTAQNRQQPPQKPLKTAKRKEKTTQSPYWLQPKERLKTFISVVWRLRKLQPLDDESGPETEPWAAWAGLCWLRSTVWAFSKVNLFFWEEKTFILFLLM